VHLSPPYSALPRDRPSPPQPSIDRLTSSTSPEQQLTTTAPHHCTSPPKRLTPAVPHRNSTPPPMRLGTTPPEQHITITAPHFHSALAR